MGAPDRGFRTTRVLWELYGVRDNLEDDEPLLPEVILEPLHVLKSLASLNEAIEALAAWDIWKASKPLAINTESGSQIHRIEIALWRLAIVWALDRTETDFADGTFTKYERDLSYLWKLDHDSLTGHGQNLRWTFIRDPRGLPGGVCNSIQVRLLPLRHL